MSVELGIRESAEMASALLGEVASPRISESFRAGRKIYTLDFSSKAFSSFIVKISNGEGIAEASKFRCEDCGGAFLRGILVSLATVNDPRKGYHLEIPISRCNADRVDSLRAFLSELGFEPKAVERQAALSLYFKSNTQIADILSYAGAMRASFEVANTYIERDIRNNENRATNFVAKNISKSVGAARRQVVAINKLIAANKLERLPSELVETALLRLENDDMSLAELALLHEPPISKSGLNNRIKKLLAEADELE